MFKYKGMFGIYEYRVIGEKTVKNAKTVKDVKTAKTDKNMKTVRVKTVRV